MDNSVIVFKKGHRLHDVFGSVPQPVRKVSNWGSLYVKAGDYTFIINADDEHQQILSHHWKTKLSLKKQKAPNTKLAKELVELEEMGYNDRAGNIEPDKGSSFYIDGEGRAIDFRVQDVAVRFADELRRTYGERLADQVEYVPELTPRLYTNGPTVATATLAHGRILGMTRPEPAQVAIDLAERIEHMQAFEQRARMRMGTQDDEGL